MAHTILRSLLMVGLFLIGCAPRPVAPMPAAVKEGWTFDHGGIVRGDLCARRMALIFTGGDYGEGADHILDVLEKLHIKASFFVTGDYLRKPRHRTGLQRMIEEKHYLGPHSDSHPLYCDWNDRNHTLVTDRFFRDDLTRNILDLRALGALPAGAPVYFIPPYEWYNDDQVAWARNMGVVLFNFTPGTGSNRDYIPEEQKGFVPSIRIMADILAYEQRDLHGLNGFILLLHLGSQRGDKTFVWIEPLAVELRRRGYQFVRIDELLTVPPHAPRPEPEK